MQQEALQSHFKRGVATLCILSLLSEREMYGYEIAQALETISGGRFILPDGQEYYAALLEDYNSIHTGVQLILSRSNEENEK